MKYGVNNKTKIENISIKLTTIIEHTLKATMTPTTTKIRITVEAAEK